MASINNTTNRYQGFKSYALIKLVKRMTIVGSTSINQDLVWFSCNACTYILAHQSSKIRPYPQIWNVFKCGNLSRENLIRHA